ncbi:MAG: hypothetical protein QOD29_1178 [Alphaproteobacteria bacterium]|jgi:hypothetical protein|nr:hypothetical protein [Alphaproteobacteria bacterium]
MRAVFGNSSRKSPSLFAISSAMKKLTPVALPSGRARLVTRPSLTGSLADTEHYWNRRRRSFRGERRRSAGRRDNDAHVPMDEISR